jgi:hypothetical protein
MCRLLSHLLVPRFVCTKQNPPIVSCSSVAL